jgi:hypothetical protein
MIATHDFKNSLLTFFAEIFGVSESEHGFILDDGQSGIVGTLMKLTAAQASAADPAGQATIAGHTGHVLWQLQFFAAHERGENPAPDWAASWSVREVDNAAWDTLRSELRTTYDGVVERLRAREEWHAQVVGASMMLLAHCAYHTGEIRQRMTWTGTPPSL